MIAVAIDVVVLHEQHDRHAGVGEDLAVGVVERAARVVRRPHLAAKRQDAGRRRASLPSVAAAAARPAVALRRAVPERAPTRSRSRWPGAPGTPATATARLLPGADLEDVAIAVVVVGHHVRARRRPGRATFDRSCACRRPGAAPACPSTSRWHRCRAPRQSDGKLLAGQVDQPDVAAELAACGSAPETIGAASIRAAVAEWLSSAPAAASRGAVAAVRVAVTVLHVGRVVVVGHDDRPAAIAAGNDARSGRARTSGWSWFCSQPPIQGKSKSVCQRNGSSPTSTLSGHPACGPRAARSSRAGSRPAPRGRGAGGRMCSCVTGSRTQSALSLLTYWPVARLAIIFQ